MCSRRRFLSKVRICSKRMTESLGNPNCRAASSMWVGSFAFPVWEVMAAAMTVAMPVSCVVLYDQHGTYPTLLAAHNRAKICIKDISTLNAIIHKAHTPLEVVSCAAKDGNILCSAGHYDSPTDRRPLYPTKEKSTPP